MEILEPPIPPQKQPTTTSSVSKSVKMDPEKNPNSVIKLDVAGTIFKTTQGTLLSDQNSMLAKMFSTERNGRIPAVSQQDTGAYFIDRCPKYFGIILNFLRGGVVEKGANVDLKFLRNEAEYFCIEGLVKVIDEEIEETEKTEKEEASKSLNQFRNLEKEMRVIQGVIMTQGENREKELRKIQKEITTHGQNREEELRDIQNDLGSIKQRMIMEIRSLGDKICSSCKVVTK